VLRDAAVLHMRVKDAVVVITGAANGIGYALAEVAEAVVGGLATERFLILPHPIVARYMQRKTADYDRWLGGMSKLRRKLQQ
jgi:hypothetical protein